MATAVGKVSAVISEPSGSALKSAALTGHTVLEVENAADFNELGGQLQLQDGTILDYIAADQETDTLTLAVPLAVDAWNEQADDPDGANDYFVRVYPISNEIKATVEFADDTDEGVLAIIPLYLQPYFIEGIREAGREERVSVSDDSGEWTVVEVADQLKIEGSSVNQDAPVAGIDLGQLAADIADAKKKLDDLFVGDEETGEPAIIENLDELAHQANDTATTADGRISISDFEPLSADSAGRVNGSLWFTRTRARANLCATPSAEVNINGWGASAGVLDRFAAPAIAGAYVFRMTNDGSTAAKYIEYGDVPVTVGEVVTGSLFAVLVSGTGTRYVPSVLFVDGAGAPVGSPIEGDPFDIVVDDWTRFWATGVAPEGATHARFRLTSDGVNSGSVWYSDACLIENDNVAGRYFDGNFYDAKWDGETGVSTSSMEGGKIYRIFELDDNTWIPKTLADGALADIDASAITHGELDGILIEDGTIPLDKMVGSPVVANEALSVGDFVNIYADTAGQARVRKAKAGVGGYPCHGFVLAPVAAQAVAFVYSHGYNPFCVGLKPGRQYLSEVAGVCTNVWPTAKGTIMQVVGVAVGASTVNFMNSDPLFMVD